MEANAGDMTRLNEVAKRGRDKEINDWEIFTELTKLTYFLGQYGQYNWDSSNAFTFNFFPHPGLEHCSTYIFNFVKKKG